MKLRLSVVLISVLLLSGIASVHGGAPVAHAQMASSPRPPAVPTGLIAPETLEKLLPATVWFGGQSAPLQMRNSAGYRSAAGKITWAGLVDTSGYSTGVREKYQFYFVTESSLMAGKMPIGTGVYGGGFTADNFFVLLSVDGTEIGRTPVQMDAALKRPRPLHMVEQGGVLRLYLGRQYVTLTLH